MELGKKIRQYRFKAGLTQEQLAEKLGIGAQSVSKWETAAAMPDITTLPRLAEIFGVSIDDLFDLTTEQRLNRIENRLDAETELAQDVFWEYEEFLKGLLASQQHQKRATELIAYLYWHRMNADAQKASQYAKQAIRRAPGEKCCQWVLHRAENHAVWDWNMANHTKAIQFYLEVVRENPDTALPYLYLLDNLIADHRADEAEQWLARYSALNDAKPILTQVYRAHIALARFDAPTADRIMEALLAEQPENDAALFEAALMCGAILADAPEENVDRMERLGLYIGHVFQITDDILDETGDPETLGKSTGKDKRSGKLTWVSLYGRERAQTDAAALSEDALCLLKEAGVPEDGLFYRLVSSLLMRKS